MKFKLNLIYFFILLFCIGCKGDFIKYESVSSKDRLIKITYKNNQKVSEQTITLDSIPDGDYKEFNSERISCSGKYIAGQKDSTWTYFYSGSDIPLRKENWFEGKRFGEQVEFYRNGLLKQYVFNNVSGKKIFLCDFDLNERIIKVDGFPMYVAYNKTLLNKGDTFELMCFFSKELPKHSLQIEIIEKDGMSKKILNDWVITDPSMYVDLPYAKKYNYEKIYNNAGSFELSLKYTVIDSTKKFVKSDSMGISLVVK